VAHLLQRHGLLRVGNAQYRMYRRSMA